MTTRWQPSGDVLSPVENTPAGTSHGLPGCCC
nr:MAG TPA_asm: hypothetical protein [Caudoviricetes sp.]